jgi:hypothetical protein
MASSKLVVERTLISITFATEFVLSLSLLAMLSS